MTSFPFYFTGSVLGVSEEGKDPTYQVIYEGGPDIYLVKHSEFLEDLDNEDLKFL